MLYGIAIVLIIISFMLPSKKLVTFFDILFMWALFSFNTANADYVNYERIYSTIGRGSLFSTTVSEEGYIYFAYFSNRFLHLNYAQFLILVATVSSVLLVIILKLYLDWHNQNIVLVLFMMLNYWVMICQYRTYIAVLLTLIGIYFLIYDERKRGIFLFILFVLAGGLFHRATLIFLIMIIIRWWRLSYVIALIPVLTGGVFLLRTRPIRNFLQELVTDYKIRWLSGSSARSLAGIMLLIVVRVAMIFIEFNAYKQDSLRLSNDSKILKLENGILKVSIIGLSFIALDIFFEEFERLFRVPLFLAFIFFALYLVNSKIKLKKMPIIVLCFIGFFVGYMIYFYIGHKVWFTSVFMPVFTDNRLLNLFQIE